MLYKVLIFQGVIMSIDENLRIVRLIDVYGSVLTEKQFSIISNYYFDNLTYAEIGENMGISRQAISDSINQSIKTMNSLEEKLGIISRTDAWVNELTTFSKGLDKDKTEQLLQIIEKYRR